MKRRPNTPTASRFRARAALLAVVPLLTVASVDAAQLNLYDWMGTAPVVLAGEVVHSSGKFVELRTIAVARGEVDPGSNVLVHLRVANRELAPFTKPLKMPEGESYLLLLRPSTRRKTTELPAYELVRGIRGARLLPPEGGAATVKAAQTLARIQDRKDEVETWRQMNALLEDTNPVLIVTSLEHHAKFQRGTIGQFPVLRPLLDHPRADVREQAARLIGQVLARHGDADVAEAAQLYAELASRARRDPVVAVRVAATEAIDRTSGEGTEDLLEEIASGDPDQQVRFTAEKLLYERRLRGEAEGGG